MFSFKFTYSSVHLSSNMKKTAPSSAEVDTGLQWCSSVIPKLLFHYKANCLLKGTNVVVFIKQLLIAVITKEHNVNSLYFSSRKCDPTLGGVEHGTWQVEACFCREETVLELSQYWTGLIFKKKEITKAMQGVGLKERSTQPEIILRWYKTPLLVPTYNSSSCFSAILLLRVDRSCHVMDIQLNTSAIQRHYCTSGQSLVHPSTQPSMKEWHSKQKLAHTNSYAQCNTQVGVWHESFAALHVNTRPVSTSLLLNCITNLTITI